MLSKTSKTLLNTTLLLLIVCCWCSNAAIIPQSEPTKTPWDLMEALYLRPAIRSFNGTWISDDEFYYTASDRSIHKYNAATNIDEVFVTAASLEVYNSDSIFTLSPDNKQILIRFDAEEVFRHSFIAKYDVFDIATRSARSIHKGEKLQNCKWSPIKDRLSYVYNNNVYIHFEQDLELPITKEGVNGIIYNGIADWVYEEEVLSTSDAMWWAPDGLKLAVGTFDDTNVESYKLQLYGEPEQLGDQYPKEIDLKYPKSGTANPTVILRVYNFSSVEPRSISLSAPMHIVSADHILKSVVWAGNHALIVSWMNRRQNVTSIQLCSLSGDCKELKRLTEPDGWVQIDTPICLKSAQNCIFTYWLDNWYQIWNLDLKTGENVWWRSLGNFTVLRVYGYDENTDNLYYQATVENDPTLYHVFRNRECLSCKFRDPEGAFCRSASASFSKNFSYYTLTCVGGNPTFVQIINTKSNSQIRDWEMNLSYRAKRAQKLEPTIEFLNVSLADGSMGLAKLYLPPNLDKSKKYPMIVNVYGGPNSVRVTSSYTVGFENYLTTKREIIYAAIDGRGTGNKGKKLLFAVNNNLGEHEVEDQIFVTKYLQKHLSYIDSERTGIWGWSYGGYVTAKTLATDSERVFQCGISVAPVTSWLYYDTIYTERFMGLPTKEDNLQKYLESSVLNDVENFRSHDFMLIHGTGDDNVHYQQSLMLAKVLQKNDVLFEQMSYVDENHSIGGLSRHLYNTMDHFWMNCLNIDVAEDDEQK